LKKKLETLPNDALTILALGKAYFAQERGDDALDCFQRAAKASPSFAEAHAMVGLELHFRGDAAGAEAAYREALRHQPGHALASLYLKDLLQGDPPGGAAVDLDADAPEQQAPARPTAHEMTIAAG
ncbi:MAG TPA: tetratricopeptide repeat protein, partial [Chloroflexota bacterium]|nr:tetratricopeptide repeat protein [Chloroflexota bacterium]